LSGRPDEEARRIDTAHVRHPAQGDVGFEDLAQRGLFVQHLAEAAVAVGEVVGVAGEGPLFSLVLQIGQFELLGEDFSEIVGAGFHFVGFLAALAGAGAAGLFLANGLLSDDLALLAVAGTARRFPPDWA
jgi:hypothetical protein